MSFVLPVGKMLLAVVVVLCIAGVGAEPWSTKQQLASRGVQDVVSWKGRVAYAVNRWDGASYVDVVEDGMVRTLCTSCSSPQFGPDGELGVLEEGGRLVVDGKVRVGGGVAMYALGSGGRVAYTKLVSTPRDPTAVVLTEDVLIDVIQNADITSYQLCWATEGTTGHCADLQLTVGLPGWGISCWPYPTKLHWQGDRILFTSTNTTRANDWETARVGEVDTTTGKYRQLVDSDVATFQSFPAPTGDRVAYTQLLSSSPEYYWAQTWRVCVTGVGCDTVGSFDAMPTIIGWATSTTLLYLEQNGTAVRIFSLEVDNWVHRPLTIPLPTDGCPDPTNCGVIGGGFRSSAQPTLAPAPQGTDLLLTFAYETLTLSPQAYAATLSITDLSVRVVSTVSNITSSGLPHAFPQPRLVTYPSSGGFQVEAIMIPPPGFTPTRSYPLVVFTHCGPAMAQLQTFMGFGTVCARFPIASWAEQGYVVLMPNYRGSTGYGPKARRSDYQDWGGGDFDDIMHAYTWAAEQGWAALDRSVHVGWSYGGYMGGLALTKAKAKYGIKLQAVVMGGSLTDLISHTGTTDISSIIKSWAGGYYWDSPKLKDMMMDHSAMYHVQNATAPTLILHGAADPRMPVSQAFQLHYALRMRGVTSRMIAFPGSGHIPGNGNQLLRLWDESFSWVMKHLPTQ